MKHLERFIIFPLSFWYDGPLFESPETPALFPMRMGTETPNVFKAPWSNWCSGFFDFRFDDINGTVQLEIDITVIKDAKCKEVEIQFGQHLTGMSPYFHSFTLSSFKHFIQCHWGLYWSYFNHFLPELKFLMMDMVDAMVNALA
jgi:hypothetical protein